MVQLAESAPLPTISIVTPSFEQVRFLGDTLESVRSQGYPRVEHVVIDGGSTDGSVDVLRRHESQLAAWVSEPDSGMYEAINKGFSRTTGEVMGWLNSDDLYLPGCLRVVGSIFADMPHVEWLTTQTQLVWDEHGSAVGAQFLPGMSSAAFLRGSYLTGGSWHAVGVIQQESTFWRRSLWERAGGSVDASLQLAGDFELWTRFARHAELYTVAVPLGGFRRHPSQKTATHVVSYFDEAHRSLLRHGGRPPGRLDTARRRALDRLVGEGALPRSATRLNRLIAGRSSVYGARAAVRVDGRWTGSYAQFV